MIDIVISIPIIGAKMPYYNLPVLLRLYCWVVCTVVLRVIVGHYLNNMLDLTHSDMWMRSALKDFVLRKVKSEHLQHFI